MRERKTLRPELTKEQRRGRVLVNLFYALTPDQTFAPDDLPFFKKRLQNMAREGSEMGKFGLELIEAGVAFDKSALEDIRRELVAADSGHGQGGRRANYHGRFESIMGHKVRDVDSGILWERAD